MASSNWHFKRAAVKRNTSARKKDPLNLAGSHADDNNDEKCKRRLHKKLGLVPKSFLLVKCCFANRLSLDDVPEEEMSSAMSSNISSIVHKEFKNFASENPLALQHDETGAISSCKCIRGGLETNLLKKDNVRIHALSQEQNLDLILGKHLLPAATIPSQGEVVILGKGVIKHEFVDKVDVASTAGQQVLRFAIKSSSLSEWHIPYEDITLESMIARSMTGPVYTGRWHGEVMVYRIAKMKKEEFLREISLLNLIRHENIILFMGASFEGPDFAIVTSPVKGYSLYTHIHEKKTLFEVHSKLSIIIQIAQAMEYLHAKKIELGKLCSRNVFLESKVKVAMMDYINRHIPVVKHSYAYVPSRQILYFSPELMRTLRIKDNTLYSERSASLAGDVYAYGGKSRYMFLDSENEMQQLCLMFLRILKGTILYEIFLEEYPYAEEHLEIVIWNSVCGIRLNGLDEIPIAVGRELFEVCWMHEAAKRPTFQYILDILRRQGKQRLKRQHSISQPSVIDLSLASAAIQFLGRN